MQAKVPHAMRKETGVDVNFMSRLKIFLFVGINFMVNIKPFEQVLGLK